METNNKTEAKKDNSGWMQVLSPGKPQLVSIWMPF